MRHLIWHQELEISGGWHVPQQLYFPPYNDQFDKDENNGWAQDFAKAFESRRKANWDIDLNMTVLTPWKKLLYCVLTPLRIIYDQDQDPMKIDKIIGRIKLKNWKHIEDAD